MTLENFNYRTSPLFLRNSFDSNEPWSIPVIPKANFDLTADSDLRLIGFDKIKNGNDNHFKRMVHFFLYDYEFESIWENPEKYIDALRRYKAVLSPDFSMYIEMNPVMQIYNTFRNRWVGAFLTDKGIKVVPTVNWGLENTFDFCFNGIEKGSVVAVSTYMVSEHENHSDQKEFFMKGYHEMLKRIEPELVICYHEPFPEMTGNILYVNYDLSSWQHYGDDDCKSANGNSSDSIIKHACGYVCFDTHKGSGSAFGGKWKPSKPQDKRLLGRPGEIKTTIENTPKGSYTKETKIGNDGRATIERHYTNHNKPWAHSNPHDHIIRWDEITGRPIFEAQINYYDTIPEFKQYEVIKMSTDNDYNQFNTINDFIWCMESGGEIEFEWQNGYYSITHTTEGKISISEANNQASELIYDSSDDALEYVLKTGEKLRDIITKIDNISRTI